MTDAKKIELLAELFEVEESEITPEIVINKHNDISHRKDHTGTEAAIAGAVRGDR